MEVAPSVQDELRGSRGAGNSRALLTLLLVGEAVRRSPSTCVINEGR